MMELVTDKRVRAYELTYLLPEALTSAEVTQVKEAIEKLVAKHKISLTSKEDWGKRELAYPIKYKSQKQYAASYVHLVLEAESSVISEFEKDLYLKQEVIRHLLVVVA